MRQNGDEGGGWAGAWWASGSELGLVLLNIFSPFIPFGQGNLVSILNPTPFEPASLSVQVGVTALQGEPPHTPTPTDSPRGFSHTSGETHNREARLCEKSLYTARSRQSY